MLSRLHLPLSPSPRVRCYADSAYHKATKKWQLEGVPRPKSILEDDDAVIDLSEDNEVANGARPGTPPMHLRAPSCKPTPHEYKAHKATIRKTFPAGWAPTKKLSREAMDALRQLHRADPAQFHTAFLAARFSISPESVSRILKSRWEPSVARRTSMAIQERNRRQEIQASRIVAEKQETETILQMQKTLKGMAKSTRRADRESKRWREEGDGAEEEDEAEHSNSPDQLSFQ